MELASLRQWGPGGVLRRSFESRSMTCEQSGTEWSLRSAQSPFLPSDRPATSIGSLGAQVVSAPPRASRLAPTLLSSNRLFLVFSHSPPDCIDEVLSPSPTPFESGEPPSFPLTPSSHGCEGVSGKLGGALSAEAHTGWARAEGHEMPHDTPLESARHSARGTAR